MPRFEPHKLSGRNWKGLRVGLLGGSFNPLHSGHIHIAHESLKRLHLDAVWFLVSPQNPFKESSDNFDLRFAHVRDSLKRNPRFIPVCLESSFATQRTFHTLRNLEIFFSGTNFVWIAGDDIAQEFHRWFQWQKLPHMVPFVFFERQAPVRRSKAFQRFASPHTLLRLRHIPRNALSSSYLRQKADQVIMNVSHKKER